MMIHKITPSVDYNLWLKRMDNYLSETTNHISIKVPEIVKQTNNETLI